MKKSTIIATCLVNSNMSGRLEDAEHSVQQVFRSEFPNASYANWNRDMDEQTSEKVISAVGRASRINVRKFIEDLWD
jgi:hypothetical protein